MHTWSLRRTRISTRLTASLLIMCIFPILVLSVFFYTNAQRTVYDRLSASTQQGIQLYATILDFHMGKCESVSDGIMMDAIVQSALNSQSDDTHNAQLSQAAKLAFNSLFMWESYMKGFAIYSTGLTETDSADTDSADTDSADTASAGTGSTGAGSTGTGSIGTGFEALAGTGFTHLRQADLDAQLGAFAAEPAYRRWLHTADENGNPCIVLMRKIFSSSQIGKLLGYVLIYVDAEQLIHAIDLTPQVQGGDVQKIILVPESGQIVLWNGQSRPESIAEIMPDYARLASASGAYWHANVEGVASVVVQHTQQKTGWTVLGILPKAALDLATRRTLLPIIVAVLLMMLLGIAFSLVIRRSINRPIERISVFTQQVSQGDFSRRLNDASPDEMGELSRHVDLMVAQINELFAQNKEMTQRRHQLELEVLQYQINPHFLFNTLHSFQYVAELNGVKSVATGITNLCAILQYTLDAANETPSLAQELAVARAYVDLQHIKYAGMIDATYSIAPEAADARVIRLMLQPIIENSIIHGMDDRMLHIHVDSALEGDCLVVTVADDGKGFDPQAPVNTRKRFSGIGLNNVRERLFMRFGDAFQYTLESELGQGTRTTLRFPYERTTEPDPSAQGGASDGE